ncbi:gliding motility-associated C-terminal domain-containing protein [Mucilaginibacter xinganensis]|nr:gliding motility-associated C-terminal domain-containing protein [Mucilaginibacter xinganensis]
MISQIQANCNDINWASWGAFTGSSATGTVTDADGSLVNVTMTSNFTFGASSGIYNFSKFNGYPSPIPNAQVPQTTWSKGAGGTTTMCFSKTVTNPVLLIASLGNSAGLSSKLDFSLPYVVLYDGGGMVYNSSTSLTGTEGYAIIMFPGDFTCVTINSTTEEYYTNITWGLRPPPFPINIQENTTACGDVTLTASGGASYLWDGGDSPNSATNTFHQSGTYIVTVINAAGCTTSASKAITVTPANIPPPVISGNASNCGSVTLTASGGVSYMWDGGDTPNSATNTFRQSGTYTVTATTASGCTATASKVVTVNSPPVPVISGSTSGCGTVTLTASGGVSYSWDGGDSPNYAVNTFSSSGIYNVTVTDANNCTATAMATVTVSRGVSPSVNIMASPSNTICPGTQVNFTANAVNGGTSPVLEWYKNNVAVASGPIYSATDLVNNDVIKCGLTSNAACVAPLTISSNAIAMTVNEIPTISIDQNAVVNGSDPVRLSPVINGDIKTYLWTPATGLSNAAIPNPLAAPSYTTTYKLTVISTAGCEAEASVTVKVLKNDIIIPNTFTPNDDGINDTWNITYLSDYQDATIDIYNRWGQHLFHSIGYIKPWDGTYNGKRLQVGTYYYVIDLKYNNYKRRSGWVAILR